MPKVSAKEVKNEAMLKKELQGTATVILLDQKGEIMTSEALAGIIKNNQGITFAIGGVEGFSEIIKEKKQLISLSNMTLPHQMARLVLTEQVYRAFTIIKNEPYHKA